MQVFKKARIIEEPARKSTSETYAEIPSDVQNALKQAKADDVDSRIDRLIESFDEVEALMQAYSKHVRGLTDLRVSVDDPEVSAALRAIDPKSDGKTMGLGDFLRAVDIMRLMQPTPEVLASTDDILPRMGYANDGTPILYYANGTHMRPDGTVLNFKVSNGTSKETSNGVSRETFNGVSGKVSNGTSWKTSNGASGIGSGSSTNTGAPSGSQSGSNVNDSQHLPALDELEDVEPKFLDGVFKRKKCEARHNWLLYLLLNLLMTDDDSLDILTVLKFFIAPLENAINDNWMLHDIFGDITWMEDLAYSVYKLKATLTCLKPYPVKCYCTESGAKIYAQRAKGAADYAQKIQDEIAQVDEDIKKTQKGLDNLPSAKKLNAIYVAAQKAALNMKLKRLKARKKVLKTLLDFNDASKAKTISEILCNAAESNEVVKAFRNADIYNYLYTKYPDDTPLFLRLLKVFDDQGYILPDYNNYFLSAEFMSFVDLIRSDISLSDKLLLLVPKDTLKNVEKALVKAMGEDKVTVDPVDDIDTMMTNLSKMFDIPYTSGADNLQDQLAQVNDFQQAVDALAVTGERLFEKRLLELGGIDR